MKRKRVLIIFISLISLVLITFLVAYFYTQVLEEEYEKYLSQLPFLYEENNNDQDFDTLEIYISEFNPKDCSINFCVLGNCNNIATLPCSRLATNEYKGEGFYQVSLNFKNAVVMKSVLYLKTWDIKLADKQEGSYSEQQYIDGLKYLLSKYPIYKNYMCVIPNTNSDVDSWQCDKDELLSHEYLKTIYFLNELGNTLSDEEILDYVKNEITYLNSKTEDFISERIKNPDAYLVKLVELGLDEKYLSVVNNFIIPEFPESELEYKLQSPNPLNSDVSSSCCNMLTEYADNLSVFREEPKYENLAGYYKYMLIREYNQSDKTFPTLCTAVNSLNDESMITDIKAILEGVMDTDSNTEGLLSVRELHQCLEYTRNQEEEIEGLESLYRNLLRRSTVTTQTGSYITNVSKVFSEEREQDIFMIEYRMLDNIMYVLYE